MEIISLLFNLLSFFSVFVLPLSEKIKLKTKIIIFTTLLFTTVVFILTSRSLLTYFLLIFPLLCIIISTKNKVINAILVLFANFISVVIFYLLLYAIQSITGFSYNRINSSLGYIILFNLLRLILTAGASILLGKYAKKQYFSKIFVKYKKILVIILIELILCTYILLFNMVYASKLGYPDNVISYNALMFTLFFLICCILVINSCVTTKKVVLAEQKEAQNKSLLKYMKILEESSTELRVFKHDYQNTLLTLDELIHNGSKKDLIKYFDEDIKPISKKLDGINNQLIPLINIKDSAIKSIIVSKSDYATLKGINIKIEITEKITKIPANSLDIARIIGIFLDNSIDAAIECSIPYIGIAFIKFDNYLQISICNSCSDKVPPLNKIYELKFTTKGTGHGYGLYNVNSILSNYDNILHYTKQENGFFTQTLQFYETTVR